MLNNCNTNNINYDELQMFVDSLGPNINNVMNSFSF